MKTKKIAKTKSKPKLFEKATICPKCNFFDKTGGATCPDCGGEMEKYLEA